MWKIKTVAVAAGILGAAMLAPPAATAQDQQLADDLRPQLMELGMESGEMEALGAATEEQLMRIKAVLNGGGGEMTKQDEISAILAEGE